MSPESASKPKPAAASVWAGAALVVAALAAWLDSFGGEPLQSWPETWLLAWGTADVAVARGINLALHVAAALGIFGVLRRTLELSHLRERFGADAAPLAFAIAAIWMLHPLQTAAVTDAVRRPELLSGACVVLTLYAFLRGWRAVSVATCALGMLAHELALATPVLVLLYERTFLTGSFREAWRSGRGYYLALLATSALVLARFFAGELRAEPAPWGEPLTAWTYLQVQCQAVAQYLRLALWPQPLVFDYGVVRPKAFVWVLPPAFLLLTLAASSVVAVWQVRGRGFLGAWFFLILVPTSTAWPVAAETIAESRMHLPLAAVVALVALGLHRLIGRRSFVVLAVVALAAGTATVMRNLDYRDPVLLWTETVEAEPGNARAHNRLAVLLLEEGRVDEAIRSAAEAVGLAPYYAEAHFNLGRALQRAGREGPARRHLAQAAKLAPERFGASR